MADKEITVAVPEERVPEFYLWFAHFLDAQTGERGGPRGRRARERGGPPPGFGPGGPGFGPEGPGPDGPFEGRGRGRRGFGPGRHEHPEPEPWSAADGELASWFYAKLAPPAQALFDLLLDEPGKRWSGNDLAAKLELEKGAHGVAGILAWPGRYCRRIGREIPIATVAREDAGTDYFLEPEVAELFTAARQAGT